MWENTFFPGSSTPTQVVHLDNKDDQLRTHQRNRDVELWPKKIWPSYSPVDIVYSDQLELISDSLLLHKLLAQPFLVLSVVRNEMTVLPHFLTHYRGLGVGCFVMVDNLSDDGTREVLG